MKEGRSLLYPYFEGCNGVIRCSCGTGTDFLHLLRFECIDNFAVEAEDNVIVVVHDVIGAGSLQGDRSILAVGDENCVTFMLESEASVKIPFGILRDVSRLEEFSER